MYALHEKKNEVERNERYVTNMQGEVDETDVKIHCGICTANEFPKKHLAGSSFLFRSLLKDVYKTSRKYACFPVAFKGPFIPAILPLFRHKNNVADPKLKLSLVLRRVRHHYTVPFANCWILNSVMYL